jgi:hypothetical protein
MKTISLEAAWNILTTASAVSFTDESTGNYVLAPVSMANLHGDPENPENEFMYLSWHNDSGNAMYAKFTEGDNPWVDVEGAVMYLWDHDGDERMELLILTPIYLENIA